MPALIKFDDALEEYLVLYRNKLNSTEKNYRQDLRLVYKIEKEELVKLYIEEGKTMKEIASIYGCSEVLVKSRLKEYQIRKWMK